MNEVLETRLRHMRARLLRRGWEYRQRSHAHGTWFRLRHLLARSSQAYLVDSASADRLEAEGCRPEPVGAQLEPPKRILVVSSERVASLDTAHEIPVRLGPELLASRDLLLVLFAGSPER